MPNQNAVDRRLACKALPARCPVCLGRREFLEWGLACACAVPLAGCRPKPSTGPAAKTALRKLQSPPLRTVSPFTYLIDYAYDHIGNAEYVRKVAEAPPQLLHLGHDGPFWSRRGPVVGKAGKTAAGRVEQADLLDPAGTRERTVAIQRMVSELHRAGVHFVIPYICNQTLVGDPDKRLGFWAFYDRWAEYRDFNLPPRPSADPLEWMQRDPDGHVHYNYRWAHEAFRPERRFAPCPNNEHWSAWLEFVTAQMAACGYDGVFVDNNILHCYCPYCQRAFRQFLQSRYTPEQRQRRFGTADVSQLALHSAADKVHWAKKQPEFKKFILESMRPGELESGFELKDLQTLDDWNRLGNGYLTMRAFRFAAELQRTLGKAAVRRRFGVDDLADLGIATPRERILWLETQLFWAWSIAANLLRVQAAGARRQPDFFVIPNWGDFGNVQGVDGRRVDAKHLGEWRRGCAHVMWEEDGQPGRLVKGMYQDRIPEYKYALAEGMTPVALAYGDYTEALTELAHAEAAASGGGAFVQVSYQYPEVRRRYRAFYEERPSLFEGLESFAHLGVALWLSEVHLENLTHLRHHHYLQRALGRGHLLHDYLREQDLTPERLRRYQVLILPAARYLDQAAGEAMSRWVEGGGVLLITGDPPSRDRDAQALPQPWFAGWFPRVAAQVGVRIASVGSGKAAWAADIRAVAPLNAVEEKWLDLGGSRIQQERKQLTEPPPPAPDRLPALVEKLTSQNLSYTTGDFPGLRALVYSSGQRLVMHLLNYEVTATEDPTPARDIPVRLLLPAPLAGASRVRLQMHVPGQERARELEGKLNGGALVFQTPEVVIHAVVEAEFR
jgi:hypothetical protein